MFRKNNEHLQQTFLTSENYMNPNVLKKLLNSWAAVFYNAVFTKINEGIFAVLYCLNNGRPNFPVNILISLEYIKHLFDYSDEELVDQFYFNYQISYALGIKNVGEMNLCIGTLNEFRRRIYTYSIENPEKEDLIFNQFIELTKGFIKESGISVEEQRMDSTMISANIKNAGRLALAFDVIEQALKVIPKEIMTEKMKEILNEKYKKKIIYKSKGDEITSRIQDVLNIGEDILTLVSNLPQFVDTKEIEILKRFISEQTKINPETGKRKAKENKEIQANSLQSAYDTDATYRSKGKKAGRGYSVNIAETCKESNDVQFMLHYDIKPNNASDADFGAEAIPEIKANFDDFKEMYMDGAYCSKDVLDAAKESDVTVHYTDMTGKKTEEDEITAIDFKFNEDNTVSSCPAEKEPIKTCCDAPKGVISAHFPKEACNNCHLKDKCCIKEQVNANKFSTTVEALQTQSLRENILQERAENTSKRAAIEGTNSELKRRHGLDNVKVLGTIKVKITTGLKITACNFKRFAKNCCDRLSGKLERKNRKQKQGIAMQF